jgi:hypothetical protein
MIGLGRPGGIRGAGYANLLSSPSGASTRASPKSRPISRLRWSSTSGTEQTRQMAILHTFVVTRPVSRNVGWDATPVTRIEHSCRDQDRV